MRVSEQVVQSEWKQKTELQGSGLHDIFIIDVPSLFFRL